MNPKLVMTAICSAAALSAAAQEYGADAAVRIWDNATAPHPNGITAAETEEAPNRPANISETVLYIFAAEPAAATGQAVVICPGGGYRRLAMDHEGCDLARWFNSRGVTAAVLKYRMPNGRPEVPLEDAVEALRRLRALAGEYGFDAAKVGIAGSSAGGHLAAMASVMAPSADRPAFSILFYPVITGEQGKCHRGSFDNLLGCGRTAEQTEYYSLENRVDDSTPRTFIALSDDDRTVPPASSTRYYDALKERGIPATMHIYPSGGHGWGMRESFEYRDEWRQALSDWLEKL